MMEKKNRFFKFNFGQPFDFFNSEKKCFSNLVFTYFYVFDFLCYDSY